MGATVHLCQYNLVAPTLDDGEQRTLRADVKGRLITTQEKRATYSAAITSVSIQSGATAIFEIAGSATRTIIVKRIGFSGTANGTSLVRTSLIKRSSANSGGTFTVVDNVSHDSTNSNPSTVVKAYTANPVLGISVGSLRSYIYTMVASNSNIVAEVRESNFGIEEDQGFILRGLGESLCINMNGAVISSAVMDMWVEWREIVE